MAKPFSWFAGRFGGRHDVDVTKLPFPRRPAPVDASGGLQANADMLLGLYHGGYKGLEFASPLAFTPILKPVNMMGLPTPYSEDEATQDALDEIVALMSDRMPQLHRAALLLGTGWRFPRWNAKEQRLVWEEIGDGTVSDILVDLATGRPRAILTHEQIKLVTGENITAYVERKRRYEESLVTVKWMGDRPAGVEDVTFVNMSGTLPVAFPHEPDEGQIRGHSALARIARDLKDYHDIDYMRSETLAKFRPKQVQTAKDIGAWLKQNGLSDADFPTFDFAGNDFILNLEGSETTKFEFLSEGATKPYSDALTNKFWKIVEGSGIPELFWGPLATGNHASTETQLQDAVSYVESLRTQWLKPYHRLFAASLRLLEVARMQRFQPFEMRWNRLESLSAVAKSEIFLRFSQSISSLSSSAMATKEQIYALWQANYPEIPVGEFADWVAGTKDMAKFRQFLGLDYASGQEDFEDPVGKKKTDREDDAL